MPEYLQGLLPPCEDEGYEAALRDLLQDVMDEALCVIAVEGSGYKTLSHRDFLGALTGLGIDRDTLGDMAVQDERRASLICDGRIATFLEAHLGQVGRDTVRVTRQSQVDPDAFQVQFLPIRDTVASPRLDCVVAALINVSRDKAQGTVNAGLVELNYEIEQKNDRSVEAGDILSVRGYGKYVVRSISTPTKKGRLRILADKYQ